MHKDETKIREENDKGAIPFAAKFHGTHVGPFSKYASLYY